MDRHPRFGIPGILAFFVSSVVLCVGPLFAVTGASEPTRADATPILEPSTLLLVGLGLVGIAVFRAKKRDPNADVK